MTARKETPDFRDDGATNPHKEARVGADVPAEGAGRQTIVAVSMKTPAGQAPRVEKVERELPHIRLRAMSEMSRAHQGQNLGNFAPPYNASEARRRTVREYLVWGSLAVVLACGIALVVWFAAT